MIKCRNCISWDNSDTYNLYTEEAKAAFGLCRNDHFNYNTPRFASDDNLVYADYEGYSAGFDTGKNFGCVHGRRKEK